MFNRHGGKRSGSGRPKKYEAEGYEGELKHIKIPDDPNIEDKVECLIKDELRKKQETKD
jgi:hypothetical protein